VLDDRIAALDLNLFAHIESQTNPDDKRSLLALQGAVRARGPYTYLEIGSHLGGSLQPFVIDPLCERIVSIDSRPEVVPDERFEAGVPYAGNSTERMLALLADLSGADISKVDTIDASTEAIDPTDIDVNPALCFIDGEHTNRAALRDARFCGAVAPSAAIAFHDAPTIYRAVGRFVRETSGFVYQMRESMFVVEAEPVLFREVQSMVRRPAVWQVANRVGAAAALAAIGPIRRGAPDRQDRVL
jgi:hypothetical protein